MASKTLFQSFIGKFIPKADTVNHHSAPAYKVSAKHELAQYAATGCLNRTFYASAGEQLETVLKLCEQIEPEFIARTALFARTKGFMKDMPALLCAVLSVKGPGLLAEVFDRVIDDGKMLRNFVQIMRSGVVGRKSLGTLPKRLVQQWIEQRDDLALFRASVGNDPSLADIIKMVHPKPTNSARAAMFGHLIGRDCDKSLLPETVRQFEMFKKGESLEVPDVPFQMLTALPLSKQDWTRIARNATWQQTRMNLNTFARHGVFEDFETTQLIAARLANRELIAKAKVFPYQLLMAYSATSDDIPRIVKEALQDAMEIAIESVPTVQGKVFVCPDVSGSMQSPVTGHRQGSTTSVRCVDVAALVAAAVLRKNPTAEVIPFESNIVRVDLNSRDSVMTNASKLSNLPCGGTNCSAPLAELNRRHASGDLVVYVSDNESWIDSPQYGRFGGSRTETMKEWAKFRARNPNAKLVCIDIQPYGTTQAAEREDILNIGGFSDQVFDLLSHFAADTLHSNHWVGVIEEMRL